jgi:hypothetical protein
VSLFGYRRSGCILRFSQIEDLNRDVVGNGSKKRWMFRVELDIVYDVGVMGPGPRRV